MTKKSSKFTFKMHHLKMYFQLEIGNEDFPMLYVGLPYQLPLRSQSTIFFACCFPERLLF